MAKPGLNRASRATANNNERTAAAAIQTYTWRKRAFTAVAAIQTSAPAVHNVDEDGGAMQRSIGVFGPLAAAAASPPLLLSSSVSPINLPPGTNGGAAAAAAAADGGRGDVDVGSGGGGGGGGTSHH